MMDSRKPAARSNGKKRHLSVSFSHGKLERTLCWFCQQYPAVVIVGMPKGTSEALPSKKPLCALHYYTTRAVRMEKVNVPDQELFQSQLKEQNIQELFAEAYTELQQELAHEAARSFQQQQSDPLLILQSLHGKPKKRKAPPAVKEKAATENDGGFLRHVPLPERLARTQKDQARLQESQLARMADAAVSVAEERTRTRPIDVSSRRSDIITGNPYQRRKPSRKSIWNLAMSSNIESVPVDLDGTSVASSRPSTAANDITCSCGSSNVIISGNVTSRNSEMTKGETWGFKDRGDASVTRYQCHSCGKTWNEED